MVVEDEGIVALDIRNILKRLGHQVTGSAFSGEEAIEKFLEWQPSLVLMDIGLKGDMDGIETAKKIQNIRPVNIVFLTGYTDSATLQRAEAVKAAGYLVKPIMEEDLKNILDKTLG